MTQATQLSIVETPLLKLDLGCGPNKKGPDWTGVDQYEMPGVDCIFKLGSDSWPFADSSVDEAHSSHLLEHLTNFNGRWERVHFFNELHRVMRPGAKCTLIFPHWNSNRYYGDPTHCEPFSEMGFYYLSRDWRAAQAPHTDIKFNPSGYTCHFEVTWGYGLAPHLGVRNQEYQQFAVTNYKDAITDIMATMTALV
jgi:SAM-dependent methyltransferase